MLSALEYDISYTDVLVPDSLDFSALGSSCVQIAGAENRGITGMQLQQLQDFLATQHAAETPPSPTVKTV